MKRVHNRADGTSETEKKQSLYRRLRLRRADGLVYLDRWGIGHDRIGRILLHHMSAPDPGRDLHDHPWAFLSIVLWGGYLEVRADTRTAVELAKHAQASPLPRAVAGHLVPRFRGSVRFLGLHECHTIVELYGPTCWTLVIGGPRRRRWGFYTADGYMDEKLYDATVRADRQDLWSDQNADRRPW
jgi:hypothetical protein